MESGYFPLLAKDIYSLIPVNNVYSITCDKTSVKHYKTLCHTLQNPVNNVLDHAHVIPYNTLYITLCK